MHRGCSRLLSSHNTRFAEHPPLASLAAWPGYRWLVVGTVCIGAFLGQLDASIAGLVLPTLEGVFSAPVASVEWVAIAYLLALAALVVPLGRLGDLVGRKVLYTWGFVVFVAGSALCGFAPGLGWLIVFRVAQAVGAAMLQANSVAIITAAVPRRVLGRAIGVQGAAQAVGLSIGPSVGGLLIDSLGWRWVFFIAVPFGLLGTILAWLVLPWTPRTSDADAARDVEHFDWLGTLLLGPLVGLILLSLTYGNSWGWASPALLSAAGLATACLALLVYVELRSASPLIDLQLLRVRSFSRGLAAGLLAYAVLFGSLFLIPFYLERVLGETAAQTGLLLTPVPIALGIMAPIAGTLTDRIGPGPPTVAGMAIAALALAGLALAPSLSLVVTLGLLAILGIGIGLFTPPNNSAVMGSAPATRLGVAGGILNMTRSLGTSVGVGVTGAVLAVRLSARLGAQVQTTIDAPIAALLPAFHETLLFLAGLAMLAAVVSSTRSGDVWRS
ncbi:MAG TPA: DHA2 family efflux MFS transporter permease subunit [Chloroflexota bacterium]|nr:DHA2 family efflux MFS transporter permease subunit [Chloroflexota bacterium]